MEKKKKTNWKDEYSTFRNKSDNFEFVTSLLDNCKTKADALEILKENTGGLSTPSKMPCHSYNLPAIKCKVGSKLVDVKGSTCYECYAMKGRYNFNTVQNAMNIRFESINKPLWKEYITMEILLKEKSGYFRWHDSGDLQDDLHLSNIVDIATYLPDVKFWLPTREYKMVDTYPKEMPKNLVIRQSAHMIDSYKEVSKKDTSSIVITDEIVLTKFNKSDISVCHATRKDSTHKCDECRACWDSSIKTIAYLKH